ncbi:MAG: hypothetical protein HY897_01175 [Deltaproteobacteria bacterium]|nr:hypothetical protein [Deltaproteobacteria bacterium]
MNVTRAFAQRCSRYAREATEEHERRFFRDLCLSLQQCIDNGGRCGKTWLCPRCSGRASRKRRREDEVILSTCSGRLAMVTRTMPVDDLRPGLCFFKACTKRFNRHRAWVSSVAGGETDIDVKPIGIGGFRRFNIHAHSLVELRDGALPLDKGRLTDEWNELLGNGGHVGNVDVLPIPQPWVDRKRTFSGVAFYVVKRVRKEWLKFDDEVLKELMKFSIGNRMAGRFGTWWGSQAVGLSTGGTKDEHQAEVDREPRERLEEYRAADA